MNTIEQQLTDALGSLNSYNWRKGTFFSIKSKENTNDILCMCAHGAVQREINPTIKTLVPSSVMPLLFHNIIYKCVDEITKNYLNNQSAQTIIKTISLVDDKNKYLKELVGSPHHHLMAHFVLTAVGLTIPFNDHPNTTFDMIRDKFQQAIALAQELGI